MGFFDKLKQGLSKTREAFKNKIDNVFKAFVRVDEDLMDELEEVLISADVGVTTTEMILDELRQRIKDEHLKESQDVQNALFDIMKEIMQDKLIQIHSGECLISL